LYFSLAAKGRIVDSFSEKRVVESLLGKTVGGWQVKERLGAGKSAVVFSASRDGQDAALKIFDPELIERSGREKQLKRIFREIALKTFPNPNLVRVLDGGACKETGCLFLVMERIDAPNLASVLKDVPRESIRPIIAQVADAARFLESLTPPIAHRDIKPDNIAISRDFRQATLLDLGVILPIDFNDGDPSSDEERRFFVGTLRYGPPEFVIRKEDYSVEGWRAITFYQLGAVLYDLIMKRKLFEAFTDPYPRLVMAIEQEIPVIDAKDVPEELILLAKNCLSKDPRIRLKYVTWGDFELKAAVPSAAMSAKDRIRRRLADLAPKAESDSENRSRSILRVLQDLHGRLHGLIKAGWASSDMFCPIECREYLSEDAGTGFVVLLISATPKLLLRYRLSIWLRVSIIDEKSEVAEIRYSASVSQATPAMDQVKVQKTRSVFAGVFQDGVVQSNVMNLLYQLIDIAQSLSGTDLADNEIRWIEVVEQAPQ
jgi:serine/threonine protein kinase